MRARAVFGQPGLDGAQDEPDLVDLGRVGGSLERLDRQPGPPERVAADERLGELGEGRDLGVGPA